MFYKHHSSLDFFSVSPVAVTNLSFCSDSSIAGLKSDPLTVLVFVSINKWMGRH